MRSCAGAPSDLFKSEIFDLEGRSLLSVALAPAPSEATVDGARSSHSSSGVSTESSEGKYRATILTCNWGRGYSFKPASVIRKPFSFQSLSKESDCISVCRVGQKNLWVSSGSGSLPSE